MKEMKERRRKERRKEAREGEREKTEAGLRNQEAEHG